jgi:hypothetical protein
MRPWPTYLVFLLLLSCKGGEDNREVYFLPDTLKTEQVAAVFREADALSLIIHKGGEHYVLIATRTSFPSFYDTLVAISDSKFRSSRFGRTYEIGADSVKVRYAQKIIHPCYNWQGQAPWKEYNVAAYPRVVIQ